MNNTKVGYVDGFVLVVPKDRVEEYRKMAADGGEAWLRHGALSYKECRGDDMHPDMGGEKVLDFPTLTSAASDETVWFSFIEFESREHRDEVNAKVMAEMQEKYSDDEKDAQSMPFDMKRMTYGGFSVEVGEEK